MAFDINKLIIDRPLRGAMMSQSGDIFWSVNDFKDPTMSATVDSTQAVDALNTPIMEFDRAKTVEFSATNAGFDLGLFTARAGLDKMTASNNAKIVVPAFDTFAGHGAYTPEGGSLVQSKNLTLNHTPIADTFNYIFALTKDGSTSVRYAKASGTSAGENTFAVTTSDGKTVIIPPTSVTEETNFLIPYEWEADGAAGNGAIEVDYSSNNFPKAGKFVMTVLAHDICDSETEYIAYIIMENAKLSSEMDLTLSPEMTDNFKIKAMPAYCSEDKRCFRIIVPEASTK